MNLSDRIGEPDENGCTIWKGTISQGYGRIRIDGRLHLAHRVVYELLVGPIPDGLTLDHLCRNGACVNPDHLEPVTRGENVLRGAGITARLAAQTHCKRGHEFTDENTYRYRGQRRCRECGRQACRAYRTNNKETTT